MGGKGSTKGKTLLTQQESKIEREQLEAEAKERQEDKNKSIFSSSNPAALTTVIKEKESKT